RPKKLDIVESEFRPRARAARKVLDCMPPVPNASTDLAACVQRLRQHVQNSHLPDALVEDLSGLLKALGLSPLTPTPTDAVRSGGTGESGDSGGTATPRSPAPAPPVAGFYPAATSGNNAASRRGAELSEPPRRRRPSKPSMGADAAVNTNNVINPLTLPPAPTFDGVGPGWGGASPPASPAQHEQLKARSGLPSTSVPTRLPAVAVDGALVPGGLPGQVHMEYPVDDDARSLLSEESV
ncbi:unnamed protein product, partial [Polarella glacialis]